MEESTGYIIVLILAILIIIGYFIWYFISYQNKTGPFKAYVPKDDSTSALKTIPNIPGNELYYSNDSDTMKKKEYMLDIALATHTAQPIESEDFDTSPRWGLVVISGVGILLAVGIAGYSAYSNK